MMQKRTMYCTLKETNVEAMVMEKRQGRGANATTTDMPLSCQNAKSCERTTFCRFVNPLTTRVPLTPEQPKNTPATTA